ncbi:MAG: endonuclease Q family protein [Candidatus Jordarchaeales archaeon]
MLFFADLHIHSKYSRGSSSNMEPRILRSFAKVKGLNLLGTGDFSHPRWFAELREKLEEVDETGFHTLKEGEKDVFFLLSNEVNTSFEFENEAKNIHHVILVENFDVAEQVNEVLSKYGNLEVDGRPSLKCSPAELVESLIQVDRDILVVPAHLWTSWFGALGERGFNSLEDCYGDMVRHIYAVETGLSSDPPMNWRLSALDKYVLMSNSDSHSPWSWRLGREANVFDLDEPSFHEIVDAIRSRNRKKIVMTIEVAPEYGIPLHSGAWT